MTGVMKRITIEKLTIWGFRAFLEGQIFHLTSEGRPQSLAVFAPNARGKSSFVDALEFFFSDQGTLERLGQRRSGTHAGREALAHFKAEERRVESRVAVGFREGSEIFEDVRALGDPDPRRPPGAERRSAPRSRNASTARGSRRWRAPPNWWPRRGNGRA